MLSIMRRMVLFLVAGSFSVCFAQEKFAVLVPGFFNLPGQKGAFSLQYFSNTILDSVREAGYTPLVIDNLDSVGSLAENGAKVLADLKDLARQHPQASFTAIAHSAGGLYLAYALTQDPTLPVSRVVTISTPYAGAELIELLKTIPGFTTITDALDLSNLQEFEAGNIRPLIAQFRIPSRVRWVALASAQPTCFLLSCASAQKQSWLLSFAWKFSGKTGDGVVATDSATAEGIQLRTREGGVLHVETWPDFVVPLEHWEAVLDSNFFKLLGVDNTDWIDRTQHQVYTQLLANLH